VHDCTFAGTDIGLRFKTRPGRGGVVEDVRVHDIEMSAIRGDALRFNMFYQVPDAGAAPSGGDLPRFRNFHITRVRARQAATAIWMRGLAEMPIENVCFEDLSLVAESGVSIENANDITLRRVRVRAERGRGPQYRNVQNLTLEGFTHDP